MKHRRKANVRSRDNGSVRMWTASEASEGTRTQAKNLFDSIEQMEAEPADFQTIDSMTSSQNHDPKVGGKYTRAQRQRYDSSHAVRPREQRRGVFGLPLSLWLTGFMIVGTAGAIWVNGNEELKEKYGLNFMRGDSNDADEGVELASQSTSEKSVSEKSADAGAGAGAGDEVVAVGTEPEPASDAPAVSDTGENQPTVVAGGSAASDATASEVAASDEAAGDEVASDATASDDDSSNVATNDEVAGDAAVGDDASSDVVASDEVAGNGAASDAAATSQPADQPEAEPVTDEELAAAAVALNNNDPEAETLYQALIERDPENAEAVGGLALLRERALTDMAEIIDQNALSDAKLNVEGLKSSVENEKLQQIKDQIDELNSMSADIDQQIELARKQQPAWWVAEGDRRLSAGNLISPPDNAAIDAYRKARELAPDSDTATQGIKNVRQRLIETAQIAADEQRGDDAIMQLQAARSISSDEGEKAEVDTMLERLSAGPDTDTAVAELITRADEHVEQNQLLGDNSAISVLNEASVIDPDNADVKQRRQSLAPLLLDKARRNVSENDWEMAIEHVDTASLLDPENEEIVKASSEIKAQASSWIDAQERLVTAQYRLKRDIILGSDGAVEVYNGLLQQDPENEQALAGLQSAADRLQVLAAKDILNERVEYARTKLEAAQAIRPDDEALQQQLEKLLPEATAREMAANQGSEPAMVESGDTSTTSADEQIIHADPIADQLLAEVSTDQPLSMDEQPSIVNMAKQKAESGEEYEAADVVASSPNQPEQPEAENAPQPIVEAAPEIAQEQAQEQEQAQQAPQQIELVEQDDTPVPATESTPTPAVAPSSTDTSLATAHCRNDYDCIGMVIDSGDPVLVQMGKEMSQMVTGVAGGTVVKPTEGPIANTVKMLSKENAGLSVVPSDMLSYTERSGAPELEAASRRLRFIMTIGQKTVYLVTRKNISSIAELDAKRVVMGPSNTAIWVVSNNILHMHGVTPSERIEQKPSDGLMALITDEVDAVFVVGPNPHPLLENLVKMRESDKYSDYAEQIHILPVTNPTQSTEYVADKISYPGIADNVDTLAILPTLVSYDFSHRQSPYFKRRCDELARVGATITGRLKELQETGHKQWKATNWKLEAGPWKKDSCFFRDVDKVAQASQGSISQ